MWFTSTGNIYTSENTSVIKASLAFFLCRVKRERSCLHFREVKIKQDKLLTYISRSRQGPGQIHLHIPYICTSCTQEALAECLWNKWMLKKPCQQMFPLKCSFNELVGYLIKFIKSAFWALLSLFKLLAREHGGDNLQRGGDPPWEAGKIQNQNRKESKCLHSPHAPYTDCLPMQSHRCPPTLGPDEERLCSNMLTSTAEHKKGW